MEALARLAFNRRRGPKGRFGDAASIGELIAYLADPRSTISAAAGHFGCSKSTVEKALRRLRLAAEEHS